MSRDGRSELSAQTALARGRTAAEALLVDACTVKRKTGESVNDTTGVVTPTYSTLYTGKCKVQRSAVAGDQRRTVGEASVVVASMQLHLPVVGSEGINEGDLATVTAAALDTDLVGKLLRVVGSDDGSYRTARRLNVIEVTS